MLRLISSFVLVACTSTAALAAERATFILTDSERKSGTVVYHGDQHENLINGYLNLGVDGGKDMTFPLDQVAVIDFIGGQPSNAELAQLGGGHMLVTRNGAIQHGRLLNMTGGDTLFFENEARQRQQYAIRDVSRVYLNTQSARNTFGYVAPPAPVAPPAAQDPGQRNPGDRNGQGRWRNPGDQSRSDRRGADQGSRNQDARMRPVNVRMNGRQTWTDAGLSVQRGDRLVFEASSPHRGLIGRIDDGQPFTIGTDDRPIVMRASGRLSLGVDESEQRIRGAFSVVVTPE